MFYIIVLLYGVQISSAIVEICTNDMNDTLCFIDTKYDKTMIPKPWPCHVDIALYIDEVFNIDDNKDTISMSFVFSTAWFDSRLNFVPSEAL